MISLKVLVTGGAGFIGSHVCSYLIDSGHDVTALDALDDCLYEREVKLRYLSHIGESDRFHFIHADLARAELQRLVARADVVIHQAATPGLSKSWHDFDTYSTNNLQATWHLLEALRASPSTHLIYASTSSVYGRFAVGSEECPTRPFSPYGVTKLAAENLIQAYRENFGLRSSILRYFSVFGPRQRPDMAYSKFCSRILNKQTLFVTGDGEQSRSNTYISDVVEATCLAAEAREDGLLANICGSETITVNEAIRQISEFLEISPRVQYTVATEGDQYATEGDASKASSALGWSPKVSVSQGLAQQASAALHDMFTDPQGPQHQ